MKKLHGIFLSVFLVFHPAVAAPIADESQTVLIGYAAPFNWVLPLHSLQAAQQAVAAANTKDVRVDGKKLRFQLLLEDDKADPRVAKFIAKSFVRAGVTAVVGHWNTDTTLATAAIYAAADVVQITTSATAEQIVAQDYPAIFQMMGGDDTSAQCVIDYLSDVMGARRIAIIEDGTPFGKNLAQEYVEKLKDKGLNGSIVLYESVSSKTSDFNAPLKRVKNANADVILFSGSLLHSGDLARAMKRLQVPGKLFLPGGSTSQAFLDMVGTDSDLSHLLTVEPGSPKEKSPSWKQFQAEYQKSPSWDVSPYTILAYDAVNLIVKGMQRSNSTEPKKIAEALHKIKFEGLSGKIVFDARGARANPLYTVYAWEAGQWAPIKTYGN